MDIFSSQVATLASHNIFLAYLIVYLATIFFGNIGAFIALWVAFQGAFGAWGVLFVAFVAVAANLTGDMLWYSAGRGLRATRLGNWIKGRFPNHGRFDEHIERKGPRWMLFAKFAYGSNFPILFSLGWVHFDFRRFIRRALLALALWLPVILAVSYGLYSGLAPLAVATNNIKTAELLFLAGIILFIFIQYILVGIFKRLFGKNGEVEA